MAKKTKAPCLTEACRKRRAAAEARRRGKSSPARASGSRVSAKARKAWAELEDPNTQFTFRRLHDDGFDTIYVESGGVAVASIDRDSRARRWQDFKTYIPLSPKLKARVKANAQTAFSLLAPMSTAEARTFEQGWLRRTRGLQLKGVSRRRRYRRR